MNRFYFVALTNNERLEAGSRKTRMIFTEPQDFQTLFAS